MLAFIAQGVARLARALSKNNRRFIRYLGHVEVDKESARVYYLRYLTERNREENHDESVDNRISVRLLSLYMQQPVICLRKES